MNLFRKLFKQVNYKKLSFKEKFSYFQELIKANDLAHQAMSEMGEMLVNAIPFSRSHANMVYNNLIINTEKIIDNLINMSGGRFQLLKGKLAEIVGISNSILHPKFYCSLGYQCPDINCHVCPNTRTNPDSIPYYYQIDEVNADKYLEVGSKMSRLGEIKNVLKLNVPRGFCLTVKYFDEIMQYNNLREKKEKIFSNVDFSLISEIRQASRETQNLFIANQFPSRFEEIVMEIFDKTFSEEPDIKLAVRSSALGEDSNMYSFAGLHHTELNVSRKNLIDACYEVLLSKYSPESVVYRFINGLRDEDMPMSVGCMEMIDAMTAGVLFTKDPFNKRNGIIIQAVWGLGVLVVEGKITPQEYIVEHSENGKILSFSHGTQTYQDNPTEFDGLKKNELNAKLSQSHCLTDYQIKELVAASLKIERHFDCPQDIEWAFDKSGKLFILQARPLKVSDSDNVEIETIDYDQINTKYRKIIDKADCASHGIASGRVRVIKSPKDFINFPMNGIIVAKKNIPEFASLIHKASGVVTDFGSTTGHLSIIARELGVPILTNTIHASEIIQNDSIITVDAHNGFVYEGEVSELIETSKCQNRRTESFRNSPLYSIWHRLSKFIFKLNLYDTNSPKFTASGCQTIHDIIRFSHETAMKLMFSLFKDAQTSDTKTYQLRFDVPLDISIIDLDNGLNKNITKDWIHPEDIASQTFLSLIEGMTTPGIRWSGHLPIDFKGYASIILGNIVDISRNDSEIGAKSYAMIAKNYFNFFSRLGYHFTRIDAYASDDINANYIHFHFRGGAADSIRKARRAKAIKMILDKYGFSTEVKDDNVIAKLRKIPQQMVLDNIRMLGRLMGAIRNTDVTLITEKHVELLAKYFLEGDPAPGLRLYEER